MTDCNSGWTRDTAVSLRFAFAGHGSRNMVMLHELGGSLESWDAAIAPLAEHFSILRFDQRGHGASEKVREPFTLEQLADDLQAVLDETGFAAPYWLVGAAAGAAIAMTYAARHPDRIAGIVMCAPALDTDTERQTYLEQRSELAAREGMRAIVDATLDRSYPAVIRTRGNREAFDTYRARFLGNDPVTYGLANRALVGAPSRDVLARLHGSCLMLAGAHDPLRPPAYVEALGKLWGDSSMVEFDVLDCAHLIAVQAPDALARRIVTFALRAHVDSRVNP
jgi:3-oxoadipate enol-lactonase